MCSLRSQAEIHPSEGRREGPDSVEIEAEAVEVDVYLRVWRALYPDAEVEILQ